MTRGTFAQAVLASAVIAAGGAHAQGVTTYHNSLNRHGDYRVPQLTIAAAATMHQDPGFHAAFTGNVYAQPLYWHPAGATPLVIVATESNTVVALNATTGATVWTATLAPPVSRSALPCGNIDPTGTTGTPVIDPATGSLYLDAQTNSGGSIRHMVYKLSLTDGSVAPGWPFDVQAALTASGRSFTSSAQGERSALLFFKGQVFVEFAANSGDCGTYYGTVVQIDPGTIALAGAWQTSARGGGIWAQGGAAGDGQSLFVTTGNTFGASSWSGGEAIIRLKLGLADPTKTGDYYVPGNWPTLDAEDADLGGTEALPITVGGGHYVIAFGKDGNAYLATLPNLGGIGGAATITHVSNAPIITAPAVLQTASGTTVAFQNGNSASTCSGEAITMLSIQPGTATPIGQLWCAPFNGRGSPMITTTDGASNAIVWAVGAEGDNALHGFDAGTGAAVFNGAAQSMVGLRHFETLIAAGNRLYVAADNTVYAYTFTP